MTRAGWRHINERLVDRIVNGDALGAIDDDGRDYEPDGHSQAEIDRRGDEAADRYEKEMDARWER